MNPIIASLGVQFMTGQIVQQNKDFMMDLVFAKPQEDLGNLSYMFDALGDESSRCRGVWD